MASNQAAWLDGIGKPLRIGTANMPKASIGQVVVRTHAVAINPVDYKIQDMGLWKQNFPEKLGLDLAGEVVEVGEGVESVRIGDRVAAFADGESFQHYVAINADSLGILPSNTSFIDGSVFPIAFQTAITGLSSEVGTGLGLPLPSLQPEPINKIIVVWGGSSSVGASVIQLAVAAGVKVVAVASARNFELLRQAGAADVVDYNSTTVVEDVVRAVKSSGEEFAGVYDAISLQASLDPVEQIIEALGGGSSIVLLPGTPDSKLPSVKRLMIQGRPSAATAAAWRDFFEPAVRDGKYKPLPPAFVVGKGLESVQKAMNMSKEGVSARKLVVDLQ